MASRIMVFLSLVVVLLAFSTPYSAEATSKVGGESLHVVGKSLVHEAVAKLLSHGIDQVPKLWNETGLMTVFASQRRLTLFVPERLDESVCGMAPQELVKLLKFHAVPVYHKRLSAIPSPVVTLSGYSLNTSSAISAGVHSFLKNKPLSVYTIPNLLLKEFLDASKPELTAPVPVSTPAPAPEPVSPEATTMVSPAMGPAKTPSVETPQAAPPSAATRALNPLACLVLALALTLLMS